MKNRPHITTAQLLAVLPASAFKAHFEVLNQTHQLTNESTPMTEQAQPQEGFATPESELAEVLQRFPSEAMEDVLQFARAYEKKLTRIEFRTTEDTKIRMMRATTYRGFATMSEPLEQMVKVFINDAEHDRMIEENGGVVGAEASGTALDETAKCNHQCGNFDQSFNDHAPMISHEVPMLAATIWGQAHAGSATDAAAFGAGVGAAYMSCLTAISSKSFGTSSDLGGAASESVANDQGGAATDPSSSV